MPSFNKSAYDSEYIKQKRKMYGWNLKAEEYQAFIELCDHIGKDRSTYLKKLVNADAVQRGLDLVFKGRL